MKCAPSMFQSRYDFLSKVSLAGKPNSNYFFKEFKGYMPSPLAKSTSASLHKNALLPLINFVVDFYKVQKVTNIL